MNLVWRDVLASFDRLAHSRVIHGSELRVLEDFRALIHSRFPYLNPYSTIGGCGGNVEALRERFNAILEQIAPGRVDQERGAMPDYYIELTDGNGSYVGRIYLRPDPDNGGEEGTSVEGIVLEMFPALTVPQAQWFYREVNLENFCGAEGLPGKGWTVRPHLTLRVRAAIRLYPRVSLDSKRYFSFWSSNPQMVKGGRDREEVATKWWDEWGSSEMVHSDDRKLVLARFSEKQKVKVCPGWLVSYPWAIAEAERLDSQQNGPNSLGTRFVTAVRQKIKEAFQAMGQDIDELLKKEAALEGRLVPEEAHDG